MTDKTGCLDELRDIFVWNSVPWLQSAACRQDGCRASWWFVSGNKRLAQNLRKRARSICVNECPVRWQCLAEYIDQPNGIFGGLDELERKYIRDHTHYLKWRDPDFLRKKVMKKSASITSVAVSLRTSGNADISIIAEATTYGI